MGLDTYIYRLERRNCYDISTGENIKSIVVDGYEVGYFRKNYCLMEWFNKRLGKEMEDCEYYLFTKKDIEDILEDCRYCLKIINDDNHTTYQDSMRFPKRSVNKIIKKFPQNNWNKKDFVGYDKDFKNPQYKPHEFGYKDYSDIEEIYDIFEKLKEDEYILYNSW